MSSSQRAGSGGVVSIDGLLLAGAAARSNWGIQSAAAVAQHLARANNAVIDWDDEAGQSWILVLSGRRGLAIVSTDLPVIVAVHGIAIDAAAGVHVCLVSGFDDQVLSASENAWREAFGGRRLAPDAELSAFSASDMWFATV